MSTNRWPGQDQYDRDMNPMAQIEAEREILRLNRLLSEITETFAEAASERAEAQIEYDDAYATHILESPRYSDGEKLLAAEREAWTHLKIKGEHARLVRASSVEKQLQNRSRNILGQLDALRSINANIRASVANPTGRGG